jgi:hypothetical protein
MHAHAQVQAAGCPLPCVSAAHSRQRRSMCWFGPLAMPLATRNDCQPMKPPPLNLPIARLQCEQPPQQMRRARTRFVPLTSFQPAPTNELCPRVFPAVDLPAAFPPLLAPVPVFSAVFPTCLLPVHWPSTVPRSALLFLPLGYVPAFIQRSPPCIDPLLHLLLISLPPCPLPTRCTLQTEPASPLSCPTFRLMPNQRMLCPPASEQDRCPCTRQSPVPVPVPLPP